MQAPILHGQFSQTYLSAIFRPKELTVLHPYMHIHNLVARQCGMIVTGNSMARNMRKIGWWMFITPMMISWWCDVKTFFILMSLCWGYPLTSQRPVMQSFYVSFFVSQDKLLNKFASDLKCHDAHVRYFLVLLYCALMDCSNHYYPMVW